MDPILKKLEAMAGMKKRPKLLSMPMAMDDRHDQQQKRKHDPCHEGRQLDFAGNFGKIRAHDAHDKTGGKHADKRQPAHDHQGRCNDRIGQPPGLLRPFFCPVVGEYGHKGRAESALGKQIPQKIGYAIGHHEGVEGKPCAEKSRKNLLADKPQNAACKNGDAHRSC